jgi:anti-anti-sigma regulatory factor
MSQDENSRLQYFISVKGRILVATFVGSVEFSTIDILANCKAEIAETEDIGFVILYFRDVETVSGDGIGSLTKMQIEIRTRSCDLNICSLKPNIKEKLLNMGVIRVSELSNNLPEALTASVSALANKEKLRSCS